MIVVLIQSRMNEHQLSTTLDFSRSALMEESISKGSAAAATASSSAMMFFCCLLFALSKDINWLDTNLALPFIHQFYT